MSHVFEYVGADLVRPLKDLVIWLDSEIDREKLELQTVAAEIKHPIGMALARPLTPNEQLAHRLAQAVTIKQSDITKARLWLAECDRKPKATYVLDFSDLTWLYRYRLQSAA